MADVNLVDLEVIKRYSLAIRQESAPAHEVLAVLDLSRDAVLAAMAGEPRARARKAPAKGPAKAAPKKAAAKASPRRATVAKKAVKKAVKKAAKKASATRGRTR